MTPEVVFIKNIMIVDDDVCIGDMLEEVLAREGYEVSRAYSGTEAVLVLSAQKPDLVLLDLMLPGLQGEEVLQEIKGIPVIIISAKVDINNKVDLLLDGAADYITKPFDTKELLARIAVQFRNISALEDKLMGEDASVLEYEDLTMNIDSHTVHVNGALVKLTKTEYAILKLLLKNQSQVITKSVMLERISEDTLDCVESSLKVHMSNLRRKLREAGGKEYIESVWGIGFKMGGQA